jgi:DNA polymerase-1
MLHEDYQAHRSEKPADFYVAREACFQQIVEMIGHPLLSAPGAEGDDVLASLAHRVCKPGWKAVIATSDKDLVACVGPHTDLLLVRSGQERIRYTPENAGEVFGVMPARVTLYKAIAGDQSDNISGVPGLGPVAARRYANEYTMPDDVMAAVTAGEITGAAAKKLTEHEGALRLSYDLAQLDRGLELEVDWNLARVSHAAV